MHQVQCFRFTYRFHDTKFSLCLYTTLQTLSVSGKYLHSTGSLSPLQLQAEQISSWVRERENTSAMLPVSCSICMCVESLRINNSWSLLRMKETDSDPIATKPLWPCESQSNRLLMFSFYEHYLFLCTSSINQKLEGYCWFAALQRLHNPICSLTSHPTVCQSAGHMTKSVRREGRESDAERGRIWGQHSVSKGRGKQSRRWQGLQWP